uniref:Ig-like domain-containing protein n=1 Tax=Amphilophus citrinellus TaxID=61819 RepID=A0A3Q0SPG6_AMPCI
MNQVDVAEGAEAAITSEIKHREPLRSSLHVHCSICSLCFLLLKVHLHSLKYFTTGSSGVPNIPEFMGVMVVDGVQTGYCDSNNKTLKVQQDWAQKILENNRESRLESVCVSLNLYNQAYYMHKNDRVRIRVKLMIIMKNESNTIHGFSVIFLSGVYIIQRISGCEWDEHTDRVAAVLQYGYGGEGFLEFDVNTLTWIQLKAEADVIKQRWNTERTRTKQNEIFLTQVCPEWLKMYVAGGKSSLQRTVLPSVSLLQKSPSSPISCHATGFYPHRAVMFWRKDGEEIHEGVDPGEILPNHDGTFQMTVDLNVSSVTPEDWSRYECVFQLSEDAIITKLNKTAIRTRKARRIDGVIGAVLIVIAAIGFTVYKNKGEIQRS